VARIVVGFDGSEAAALALRWAVDEGRLRQATVDVVLAWSFLDQKLAQGEVRFRPDYGEDDAKAFLEDAVQKALEGTSLDGIDLQLKPVCDLAAHALLEAADGADLLVVGSRGLGGLRGALLGSISEQCVQHSSCPVVVVRGAPAPD